MTQIQKFLSKLGGVAFSLLMLAQIGCQTGVEGEITITTKSGEARKLFLEGLQLSENLRGDEAREFFSKAIEADPDFAYAHLYRAFSATSAEDFQEHLDKAVALAPNVSEGERLTIEGVRANVDNNPVKAVEIYEQLVEKFPNDKRARQFLGGSYGGQDEDDKAIAQYQKAIEIDENFATAYNSLGYAYIQKEDYYEAERAFLNYIDLIPGEANPHDSIADMYTRMGRHDDAIEHYMKAVKLNPKFSLSQRNIGTNLVFMGNYEDGREAFRKAMAMEMTETAKVTDMNQIARSHLYEGNFEQAIAAYDESIKMAQEAGLSGRIANIHSQKCYVHLESGHLAKAEQSLAECKKTVMASDLRQSLKDNFAKGAIAQEALIAAKKGDFEAALAKADEHLAKIQEDNDPSEVQDHHGLLGLIHFEKGDHTQAIEHLNQGDQEDPYTLYHLAVAESKAGDPARANELFSKVADMNQDLFGYGLGYALVRSKAMDAKKMSVK
ncbi:tetratricopeptide repeat protein [candidate division KSB1 bacterium]|nr:tetratricopeptide repeat protein [candidate division KSB1 bacterium]